MNLKDILLIGTRYAAKKPCIMAKQAQMAAMANGMNWQEWQDSVLKERR